MMKIRLICVGRLKERFFEDAVSEYKKRLSKFTELEIVELPDEKTAQLIDAEAKALVDEITARTRKILTDNWEGLKELAGLLIEKEVIMSDDIERIFGPKAGKHGEERLKKDDE